MKSFAATIAALLLLAGCAEPMSHGQLERYLDRVYGNHPVEQFFFGYGRPVGEFKEYDGGHVYRWASLQPTELRDHGIAYFSAASGHMTVVDNYNGLPQAQYCELRIYTDEQGIVEHFAVVVDSIGKWTASRCTEILY